MNPATHTADGYQGCQKSDKAVIDTKREIAKAAGVSHDTISKRLFRARMRRRLGLLQIDCYKTATKRTGENHGNSRKAQNAYHRHRTQKRPYSLRNTAFLLGFQWCTWRGSNSQPSASEADALSN